MPFNIGAPELMIIMVIVLIVFGAGKLPNVMKDLGAGVREFKKAQAEDDSSSGTGTVHTSTTAHVGPPASPSSNAPVSSTAKSTEVVPRA